MATRAFVLIETSIGKTKDVVNNLRKVPGMKSVEAVTGPYDVIAVVEAKSLTDIGDLVTREVHTVEGITRTVTCLAINLTP